AVSTGGPPPLPNPLRGQRDSFERAAAGVRAVARRREEAGSALPMLIAIVPITELNLTEIEPALEALRELPLDTINVGLRWFVPKEAGARYEQVMRETFGIRAESWEGLAFPWAGGNGDNGP